MSQVRWRHAPSDATEWARTWIAVLRLLELSGLQIHEDPGEQPSLNFDAYLAAIEFIESLDRRYPENFDVGWVYAMRNTEFKRPLIKVGMTTRPPHGRASELAGTAVPGIFELIYFVHVGNARYAESLAHQALAKHRRQANREFFEVSIGQVVTVLDQVANHIPVLRSQANKGSRNPRSKPIPQAFGSQIRACPYCHKKNRVRVLAIATTPKCGSCSRTMPPA